jgi:hypothetical protein
MSARQLTHSPLIDCRYYHSDVHDCRYYHSNVHHLCHAELLVKVIAQVNSYVAETLSCRTDQDLSIITQHQPTCILKYLTSNVQQNPNLFIPQRNCAIRVNRGCPQQSQLLTAFITLTKTARNHHGLLSAGRHARLHTVPQQHCLQSCAKFYSIPCNRRRSCASRLPHPPSSGRRQHHRRAQLT